MARGIGGLTCVYRDFGASRQRPMRESRATFAAWAVRDPAAAKAKLAEIAPSVIRDTAPERQPPRTRPESRENGGAPDRDDTILHGGHAPREWLPNPLKNMNIFNRLRRSLRETPGSRCQTGGWRSRPPAPPGANGARNRWPAHPRAPRAPGPGRGKADRRVETGRHFPFMGDLPQAMGRTGFRMQSTTTGGAAIVFDRVGKSYPQKGGPDVMALEGISLAVPAGSITGIIGRSGAGKSTLLRMVNGLERPGSGRITVGGRDVGGATAAELRELRREVGMIFQHFNLLSSRTVRGNVALPMEIAGLPAAQIRARVDDLVARVGLEDLANRYPAELSGGQKQRVGIARALATGPKVLLSDEATSALDPQTTHSILELLRDINQKLGLTIVIITHEMQVIKEICDRVAVMENGLVIEEGSVIDLFVRPQTPTTKEFIRTIVSHDLPDIFAGLPFTDTPQPGSNLMLRLSFIGSSANEPVIAGLIRRFNVDVNILFGNIDHLKNTPFGTLLVEVSGDDAAIQSALRYLQEIELGIEVIGYVARNARATA